MPGMMTRQQQDNQSKKRPPKPKLPSIEDRARIEALGLKSFTWTRYWSFCWNCGRGTHIRKEHTFQFDTWLCLDCGVTWMAPSYKIRWKRGQRNEAAN